MDDNEKPPHYFLQYQHDLIYKRESGWTYIEADSLIKLSLKATLRVENQEIGVVKST